MTPRNVLVRELEFREKSTGLDGTQSKPYRLDWIRLDQIRYELMQPRAGVRASAAHALADQIRLDLD